MCYLIKFIDMIVNPDCKIQSHGCFQCKFRNTLQINDGQFNTKFQSFQFQQTLQILNIKLNVIWKPNHWISITLINRKQENETRFFFVFFFSQSHDPN